MIQSMVESRLLGQATLLLLNITFLIAQRDLEHAVAMESYCSTPSLNKLDKC